MLFPAESCFVDATLSFNTVTGSHFKLIWGGHYYKFTSHQLVIFAAISHEFCNYIVFPQSEQQAPVMNGSTRNHDKSKPAWWQNLDNTHEKTKTWPDQETSTLEVSCDTSALLV